MWFRTFWDVNTCQEDTVRATQHGESGKCIISFSSQSGDRPLTICTRKFVQQILKRSIFTAQKIYLWLESVNGVQGGNAVSSERRVPCNHTVTHAHIAYGGNFLWMWGERTAEKVWSSSLGFYVGLTTRLGKISMLHNVRSVLGLRHMGVGDVTDVSEVRRDSILRVYVAGWWICVCIALCFEKKRGYSGDWSSFGRILTSGPSKGHAAHQKSTRKSMLSSGHPAKWWLGIMLLNYYA
jgi:hypothetical protein